jgi:fission process protein 1
MSLCKILRFRADCGDRATDGDGTEQISTDIFPTQDKATGGSDVFRDTWIRYLGYANEVGEAFGPIFPRYVIPSYGVAFAYVFADANYKIYNAFKNEQRRLLLEKSKIGETEVQSLNKRKIAVIGADALIWQTFASVLIPGKCIHFVTNGSKFLLEESFFKNVNLNKNVRKWGPTAIGLLTIPVIIHPIDQFVDYAMDNSIRKVW